MKPRSVALDPQKVLDAALRQDLGAFIVKTFNTVSPGRRYHHGWHIDAIIHHLMQVHAGEIARLIIAQPPRSLKSISVSVAYVAWSIGHDPGKRFACISYSADLAGTFARQFRAVINANWFKRIFPNVRWAKESELECATTKGGGRLALSTGGSITGRGADVIILDDPSKADDAQSEVERENISNWFGTTLASRLDDKKRGAIILVAQRLHEDDLAGKLLRQGGWRSLELPAIADRDEDIPIGPQRDHFRKKGDVLHPEHESLAELENLRREMGSLKFSAQYLQRPVPAEGNLIKRDWIKSYGTAPIAEPGAQIIQSWDVASTTAGTSDWSACSTWLKIKRSYYLLDVWRGRLEFPDVRRKLIALALAHRPNTLLIEQAGPGLHLIQELRASPVRGVPLPIGIKPDGDKCVRMEAQCARFESGQVFLPKEVPWLSDFLHELLAFPHGRHDDQVDSVSQFLNWAEQNAGRWPLGFGMVGPKIIHG